MTKETQTFAQWRTLLLEWLDDDEIVMSFDMISRLYHRGSTVKEVGELIRESIHFL